MIPRTEATWQSQSAPSWQQQLQQAITDPETLLRTLKLEPSLLAAAKLASQQFALRVPQAFIERMEVGNINDPLLKQVLPLQQELIARSGYSADPLAEQNSAQAGLIQKYRGRVLLMVSTYCAVNCRYCFRRHFPYEDNRLNREQWSGLIQQIADDTTIDEVIYSGGDPLAANDRQLQWLTEQIAAIPHIKRLRIHSRLPVVIPDRITDDCLHWLANHRLQTVFVLHINHPNEINGPLIAAAERLKSRNITLLNQSVLLKGVNDRLEVLKALSEDLFSAQIMPYYLHLLDEVAGAAHFDIPLAQAEALYQQLIACLPGYLVPKLVKEIPGEPSKTPITPRLT